MPEQRGYGIHLIAKVEVREDDAITDDAVYVVARDVRDELIDQLGAQVNLVIESTNRESPQRSPHALIEALGGAQGGGGHGHSGGGQYL